MLGKFNPRILKAKDGRKNNDKQTHVVQESKLLWKSRFFPRGSRCFQDRKGRMRAREKITLTREHGAASE